MVELQWRLLTTLFYTFTIIAGTLAAAHYCSRLNHCATSPNSGSEHSWGISLTQDSRDSDFDSDCHSNTPPPRHIHTSHLLHVLSIPCVPSRSPCLTILFLSELSSFRSCAPDRDLQENKPTSSEREADSISFASMEHKQREMHGGRKGKRVRLKNIIERRHDVIQRIQVKC